MPDFNKQAIIDKLKSKPGEVLLDPSGICLYALTKDAEGKDLLLVLTSDKNLNDMSVEEVNQFIIDTLKF